MVNAEAVFLSALNTQAQKWDNSVAICRTLSHCPSFAPIVDMILMTSWMDSRSASPTMFAAAISEGWVASARLELFPALDRPLEAETAGNSRLDLCFFTDGFLDFSLGDLSGLMPEMSDFVTTQPMDYVVSVQSASCSQAPALLVDIRARLYRLGQHLPLRETTVPQAISESRHALKTEMNK